MWKIFMWILVTKTAGLRMLSGRKPAGKKNKKNEGLFPLVCEFCAIFDNGIQLVNAVGGLIG